MGSRGLYGFIKDGVEKATYSHGDSYPSYLGRDIIDFIIVQQNTPASEAEV